MGPLNSLHTLATRLLQGICGHLQFNMASRHMGVCVPPLFPCHRENDPRLETWSHPGPPQKLPRLTGSPKLSDAFYPPPTRTTWQQSGPHPWAPAQPPNQLSCPFPVPLPSHAQALCCGWLRGQSALRRGQGRGVREGGAEIADAVSGGVGMRHTGGGGRMPQSLRSNPRGGGGGRDTVLPWEPPACPFPKELGPPAPAPPMPV